MSRTSREAETTGGLSSQQWLQGDGPHSTKDFSSLLACAAGPKNSSWLLGQLMLATQTHSSPTLSGLSWGSEGSCTDSFCSQVGELEGKPWRTRLLPPDPYQGQGAKPTARGQEREAGPIAANLTVPTTLSQGLL